ncbi:MULTISPECIES: MucB/RseB C-terminal domain-containing protein [Glaesserella]|uniref:Negative regulator of sigmaE n=1 Tax=Glaesserella australis TaxID=2094024 RepID=A0A328C022_9PAST|nr:MULTISPECIES: MucB/RseB C-terminal domain-containing protein [Glaesserella]AUI65454.1 negative regulator of sigmaE [Glaesserella sp. 15-184]RAL19649.1 negative regulator of sigmaE [Glaesserella australis]
MKKFSRLIVLFSLFWALPVWAELSSPLDYLKAMTNAHKTRNYEQLYILQSGENVLSFRYRHAYHDNKEYAQLLHLDETREEMILRDNTVGYFGDYQPFSLQASRILDNLPSVIHTNFEQLSGYSFVDAGKSRVADHVARVIRVVPRDDFRYQYILWIDEDSHLLLQSQLLDRDQNVLELFRAIQSVEDEQLLYIVEPIRTLILPTLIQAKDEEHQSLDWNAKWVPAGFKPLSVGRQRLSEVLLDEQVESQLYSDGLFSFTVYVLQNKGVIFDGQFWREGKTGIYSQTVGERDVVIVGEIPAASARHIVQQIQLDAKVENK